MAKATKTAYTEAVDQLRKWLPPGSTCYTILESVSRSGMSRQIRAVLPYLREQCNQCSAPGYPDRADGGSAYERPEGWRTRTGMPCAREGCGGMIASVIDHLHPNHAISVVTGYRQAKKGDGIILGGCGMDMGFALVYALSSRLYGGQRCTCGYWLKTLRGAGPRLYYDQTRNEYTDNRGRASHYSTVSKRAMEDRAREAGEAGVEWIWEYAADCTLCRGTGNVIGTGYQCLGKGRCPCNYHSNHKDRIRCEGVERGGGEQVRCGAPGGGFFRTREEVPEDWPRRQLDIGEGQTIDGPPLHTLFTPEGDYGREICPTCKGEGTIPNPNGPERFDLEHFDGYAISQRWL